MGDNESAFSLRLFRSQTERIAVMLIAFLAALVVITIVATFPTFWIRRLTVWFAHSEAKRQGETGDGGMS